MKIRQRATWTNSIKSDRCQPIGLVLAENAGDLVQIIQEAESKGIKVKVAGTGHSFNNIACTNGYLVDISRLDKFMDLPGFLKPQVLADSRFVNVEAGIRIRAFNKALDKRGLSVVNMGGIDHQTLAGAISTGTHGSGKDLPAFSGMVRSLVLVSSGGKRFRIEPANGISDPGVFNEPETTLVQNDDDFNSIVIGLGAFGIVYSVIMETVEMYWLKESKKLENWESVQVKLRDGSLLNSARSVMIQVNPYKVKGERSCIVVRHDIVPAQKRSIFQKTRNIISSWFSYIPIVYYYTRFQFFFFPKNSPKLILSSLKSLQDKEYINKSYKVLYQGIEYIKERAYDAEFAFDTGMNYCEVLEALFRATEKFAAEGNLYTTSPMGMRFVKSADYYLTPEYKRSVCYIDTPFLNGTQGVEDMLEEFQQIMFDKNGIPHWGKKNYKLAVHLDKITGYYPKIETWKKLRAQYDPGKIFINAFLEKFGLG